MAKAAQRPHEKAVTLLEQRIQASMGHELEAVSSCNECGEQLKVNLVQDASRVERDTPIGQARPDLAIFDAQGLPLRFIEVVDTHKPSPNVHGYALENNIDVFEFHLNAREREFVGRRKNRALDAALVVKARLRDLERGTLVVDAHTLLCQRPKCQGCSASLPLRTITIRTKDCWKCGEDVRVAVGDMDGEALEQDYFTYEERDFAKDHGVTLERRFSATVGAKYLANICTNCNQIQGNWFLYMDPLHDRFSLDYSERKAHGPCVECATKVCTTHSAEYYDYTGDTQCPECVREAEKVMCPNVQDKECFYPERCKETGCYFGGAG